MLQALTRLSKDQIHKAGHRYTPAVEPGAPNLRIESLFTAIENLACGPEAFARFEATLDSFAEAWDRAKRSSQRAAAVQAMADTARAFLPQMMTRLRSCDASAAGDWSVQLSVIEAELERDMAHWNAEEAKLPPAERDSSYSSARSSVRESLDAIGRCLSIVRNEQEFVQAPAFKVLFDPQLLVGGAWGTGKTHLLCDVTQGRIGRGQATALVLAKNFQGRVVAEVCSRIEPGRTPAEVFDQLETLASQSSDRAIVILEGVNEGNRRDWWEAVSAFQALVASRPNIGLVVTCRSPLEPISIEQTTLAKLHKVFHQGFDDQEFDAQAAFFEHYKLPLPEVPLLDQEFSRPLTLKLICQSLRHLSGKKLLKGFAGIASGQKGMTYVLESFIKEVGDPIERRYGMKTKACWELLKGHDRVADRRLAGFAPCMAATLKGYVLRSEADRIIAANHPSLTPAQRRRFLEELRTSGLIEEDAVWYSAKSGYKSRVVFRLPYQRFSDHLVARHLLKSVDLSSPSAIRKSFSAKSQLSRIFGISNRHYGRYAEPGWAQALITEFPERVGTHLPARQREIFFVLPKPSQDLNAYFEPFMEGIFWRDPNSFTLGTRDIINKYLNSGSQAWERMVDALAAVCTKPKHPYHAGRLYAFLARWPMPDRDLRWSEYIRRRYASPTIHRLLTWAQKLNAANMTRGSASGLVVLLSLVLTTVVRNDRDLATKALVFIGERFPDVLFAHTLKTLEFNDPYVPERMLAAAYGVTLSLVDSEAAATFRPTLGEMAKKLYGKMFAPRARHATHHTLMRDYASGIIQMAQRAGCVSLPTTARKNLSPPYPTAPSTFTSDGTPDQTVNDAIGHAIQMDFGNYTIGRLIPNRANYDAKKPDYVRVRAKIERRIFDLGYRAKRFERADNDIGRTSWRAQDHEKVDRYGKKYSWIAYFEMYGEREAVGKLPDLRLGERVSDCGVDPSFPKRPPQWTPPMPNLVGDASLPAHEWVRSAFTPNWHPLLAVPEINGDQGQWVLVEGFVQGVDEKLDRELTAFLRGVFVARKDVRKLKSRFLKVDYPGNSEIPEGLSEHYLFAGEAGRRQNYARRLYRRNGRYQRQIAEAFDRQVPIRIKASSPATTIKIKVLPASVGAPDGEDDSFSVDVAPFRAFRRIPGVRLEVPFIRFDWESYHSSHNDFSGFDLPAPSLIQRMGLASRDREIDFYDSTGRPGTLYREAGESWNGNRHQLLYVRADLLRRYLKETRQVLVWCNWGERNWLKQLEDHVPIDEPFRRAIYQANDHIHRTFSQWNAASSTIE